MVSSRLERIISFSKALELNGLLLELLELSCALVNCLAISSANEAAGSVRMTAGIMASGNTVAGNMLIEDIPFSCLIDLCFSFLTNFSFLSFFRCSFKATRSSKICACKFAFSSEKS